MKAKDLIAKLNKLVQINPGANIYFYAGEYVVESIGKRILEGKSLSRTYEGGEGLVSINIE